MSETINGSLSVSNDVIADIAGYAAMTCYGVVGMAEQLQGAESVRLLAGQRLRKGVLVSADENGLTVNPHDLPADHYGSKVMCGSCHKMHDTKEIEVSAANACLGCHHDNVYECGTCHAV